MQIKPAIITQPQHQQNKAAQNQENKNIKFQSKLKIPIIINHPKLHFYIFFIETRESDYHVPRLRNLRNVQLVICLYSGGEFN